MIIAAKLSLSETTGGQGCPLSMKTNTVNLSNVELEDKNSSNKEEELQEYQLGDIVSTEDGDGVIAAFVEESFEFPVGQSEGQIEEVEDPDDDVEMRAVDASPEDPVYIVALQDGGSIAVTPDEISTDGSLEGDGKEITEWPVEDGAEAETAPVYQYMDDPSNMAELQQARKEMIMERQAAELADYVEGEDVSLAELEEHSYEELVNIRGVDDPHVGFDELPPGWTRKSVLQAWASLGGMWRTCYARMMRVRGPNFAKRWCAALKDETLRTEEWRGGF